MLQLRKSSLWHNDLFFFGCELWDWYVTEGAALAFWGLPALPRGCANLLSHLLYRASPYLLPPSSVLLAFCHSHSIRGFSQWVEFGWRVGLNVFCVPSLICVPSLRLSAQTHCPFANTVICFLTSWVDWTLGPQLVEPSLEAMILWKVHVWRKDIGLIKHVARFSFFLPVSRLSLQPSVGSLWSYGCFSFTILLFVGSKLCCGRIAMYKHELEVTFI